MAKTLAEIVAERANPSGKSSAEMTRDIMMRKAAESAAKQPARASMQDKSPAEAVRERAEQKAYDRANMDSTLAKPTRASDNEVTDGRVASDMKRGGKVRKMATGGYVRKADGIAQRGKTRGRMV
jgi:hypothetical protein